MALTDSLIEYWKMEDANGVRNSINLTQTGTPTKGTGIILNGRVYSANNYDNFTYSSALGAGTFSWWFNYTSVLGNQGRMINKTHAAVSDVIVFDISGTPTPGLLEVTIHDVGGLNANATTLSTGTWYFYAVTWDGSHVIVYKNGAVETNNTNAVTMNADATVFSIGGTPVNTAGINGTVDEIGFWSRALTSTEISRLYNGGAGLTYPFHNLSFKTNNLRPRAFAPGLSR